MNFNGFILDTEMNCGNCEERYFKLLNDLESIIKIIGSNTDTLNNRLQTQYSRIDEVNQSLKRVISENKQDIDKKVLNQNETFISLRKMINENKDYINEKFQNQAKTNQSLLELTDENKQYINEKIRTQLDTNQSLVKLINEIKEYTDIQIKSQQAKIEDILDKNVENKILLLQSKLNELLDRVNANNSRMEEKINVRIKEIKYSDTNILSIIEEDTLFIKGMFLEATGYNDGRIKVKPCSKTGKVVGIYINKNFMSRSTIQEVLITSESAPSVNSPLSISDTLGFGEISDNNVVGYVICSTLFHGNIYKCLSNIYI